MVIELHKHPTGIDRSPLRPLGLTARQTEVLALLAAVASNRQIARALRLSPNTVRKHLEYIYSTLGAINRTSAAAAPHRAHADGRTHLDPRRTTDKDERMRFSLLLYGALRPRQPPPRLSRWPNLTLCEAN